MPTPIICPAGSAIRASLTSMERTSSVECDPGTYAPIDGMPACLYCPRGSFQDEAGETMCYPCPPGRFANRTGAPHCEKCEKGASVCQSCPPGYHVNSTRASKCKMCPAGFFSEEGDSYCTKCDAGTYNDLEGQAQCTECRLGYGPGYVAGESGMSSCKPCTSLYSPMTSNQNFTNCVLDEEATLALVVIVMAMTVIWILLPSIFQWRIGIDDVYAEAAGGRKRIIVRTQQSHWLSFFRIRKCRTPPRSPKVANLDRIDSTKSGATEKSVTLENAVHISVSHRVEIPVTFAQTGHPFLDSWLMNTAAARAVQAAHELIEKVSSPMKPEEVSSKKKQLVQPLTRHHLSV